MGTLLFDAVAARVEAWPEGRRPQLWASGESLGAYSGNGAFTSGDDMLGKVDGAVWTGPPSFTPLQANLAGSRSYGSTVVNPVLENGRHIRFAGSAKELTADELRTRISDLAVAADRVPPARHRPVVWWSTDLRFTTPTWLDESRTPGAPMSRMSWLPVVTFWQVTADMAMSNNVRGGFGHWYVETETVPAWAGVLGMSVDGDYSRIQAASKAANQG